MSFFGGLEIWTHNDIPYFVEDVECDITLQEESYGIGIEKLEINKFGKVWILLNADQDDLKIELTPAQIEIIEKDLEEKLFDEIWDQLEKYNSNELIEAAYGDCGVY